MSTTKRIGDTVVQFYTTRGVRCFRLVKNQKGRQIIAGHFTMRVKRNSRVVYFALPSTQARAAKEANKIDQFLELRTNTLDAAIKHFDPDRFERLNPSAKLATVGDVLDTHKKAEKALGLNENTAASYRKAMLTTFRQGLAHRRKSKIMLTNDEIRAMSMAEFTHRLVSDFKIARMAVAGTDKADIEVKKRSTNCVARSVSSLFSHEAMKHYKGVLVLPSDLTDVLASMSYSKVSQTKYRLPHQSVIKTIFDSAVELRNGIPEKNVPADVNAYLAFLLTAHAGQRVGEVTHAVLDWIEDGEKPRIWVRPTPDFVPKAKDEGWAEVHQWVVDEIRALAESPSLILSGDLTEREDRVFRRLNTWLKGKGLKIGRSVHEMRKLFGSYIANTQGIFKAQKMLRQSTPQLTSDTYADVNLDAELYALWEKRPAWAVQPQEKKAVG